MPVNPGDGGGEELEDATAARTTGSSPARARRSAPRWPVFVGLAVAVVVLDQLTKAWIVSMIEPGGAIAVLGDWVRLVYSRNTGALFGLFRDNATLFGAVSVAVVAAIVWYHGRAVGSAVLSVALGLLLGGALGNLADRLARGHVVDFVDAGIGGLRWYTFNVADAAISLALILLVLLTVRPGLAGDPDPDRPRPPDA